MWTRQYYHEYNGGVRVDFFGRSTPPIPRWARIARQFDCPVYGVRVVRLPNIAFASTSSARFELPRDAEGQIEYTGNPKNHVVIGGWIREHPEMALAAPAGWRNRIT